MGGLLLASPPTPVSRAMRKNVPVIGLLVLAIGVAAATAQPLSGALVGRVTDASGGALPGVAVTVTCPAADVTAATVTDGAGQYQLDGLPVSPCVVIYELAGFDTTGLGDVVVAAGRTTTIDQRMEVAPVSETVDVVASLPPDPPKPRIVPEPRPVPMHDIASVCGPSAATAPPTSSIRLAANRDGSGRVMYGKGDVLLLDAGTGRGLKEGDNLVVRRQFRINEPQAAAAMIGEHTSGLIQVVTAEEEMAEAVVVYACDEFVRGDYVEPFQPIVLPTVGRGTPDLSRAARILFADEGQSLGAPRRMMVIDRGRSSGTTPGQRWTIFRRVQRSRGAVDYIGEAVVVAVKEGTATIRIEHATDAIYFGDLIAPQTGKPSAMNTGR